MLLLPDSLAASLLAARLCLTISPSIILETALSQMVSLLPKKYIKVEAGSCIFNVPFINQG